MTERIPLLIGVTGKRQFVTGVEADKQCEEHVRRKLEEIFESLDKNYPLVPKILLTGAAYGTDLIAARAALAQNTSDMPKRWAVAALLPFEHDEFLEDFKTENNSPQDQGWPGRYEAHQSSFKELIDQAKDGSGRVIVRELPRLSEGFQDDESENSELLKDASWSPATKADLENSTIPRNWYYEQVGQFIAESADLMIAVMPKDTPANPDEATGGTARIVAYRRIGRPDRIGNKMARHSAIVRRKWPNLAAPPGGFVWLVEPPLDSAGEPPDKSHVEQEARPLLGMKYRWEPGPFPVEVLPPLECYDFDPYPHKPAEVRSHSEDHDEPGPLRTAWHAVRKVLAWARVVRSLEAVEHQHDLTSSLISAKALRTFNDHKPTSPHVVADVSDIEDLTKDSRRVADLLSDTQMEQNKKSRRSFRRLATLFVLALVTFEIYAKFFSTNPLVLLAYLVVLFLIAWVVFRAAIELFQATSEDYRAVAEMMRVQHAWWSAGLHDRVDRQHLQGVDRELSRIRDGATGIIAWLLVRHKLQKPKIKWPEVRGAASRARTREDLTDKNLDWSDWIGSQLTYFSSKEKSRHESVRWSDAVSWTLVAASAFMALILWIWLVDGWFWHDDRPVFHRVVGVATFAGLRCPIGVVVWSAGALAVIWFAVANRDLKRVPAVLTTAILSLAVALMLSFAVADAAQYLPTSEGDHLHTTPAKYLMMVVLVGLSAAAGALRYYTERLNVEAEAHEYRDAKLRFERAEHLLFSHLGAGNDDEAGRAAAQPIVRELGLLALAENEAWLKSRRERPLTPVVG